MANQRTTANARGRKPKPPPVDRNLAVRMFEVMALMRAVEDRMVTMYKQGELLGSLYTGHWHEAIAVGTAAALRPTDVVAPLHRDLGVHLWRGMEPWQVMASFMGKATSPTGGRDGTLHYGRLDLNVINPVSHIPNNYPVATGAAFALRYRGTDGVAMAYCGDGSTGRGTSTRRSTSRRSSACPASSSSRTTSTPTPPRSPSPPRPPTSPARRRHTGSPVSGWTASMCSRCTRPRSTRSPGPGPGTARRSSRR